MQAKEYAKLFVDAGEKNFQSVLDYLYKSGKVKLLPVILKEISILAQKKKKESQTILITSKKDAVHVETIKKTHPDFLSNDSDVKEMVDESLIGGYVLKFNHKSLDLSYKRKLVDLYQTLKKVGHTV